MILMIIGTIIGIADVVLVIKIARQVCEYYNSLEKTAQEIK